MTRTVIGGDFNPNRIQTKLVREDSNPMNGKPTSRLYIEVTVDGVDCGKLHFLSHKPQVIDAFLEGTKLGEI